MRFDGEGRVVELTRSDNPDRLPHTEYHNGILIPGMTNGHCHLELSFFKGAIPQHTGLVGFIEHVVGQRNTYSRDEQVERAIEEDRNMWLDGIQAVGDISNGTASFPAKVRSRDENRIHYHTFVEYFGMPEDTEEAARAYYEEKVTPVLDEARRLGLVATPTQHSTYLMSERLFRLGAITPRASIHFMETPSELGLYERAGGMYEYMLKCGMQPDFLFHGSHPDRLLNCLPKDLPLLLIHDTQMSQTDIDKVLNYFTDVTFVLCPRSNYYIEAAFPPAEKLWRSGARVALGTDSLSSNTSLSLTEEIKWVSRHNPDIPLEDILQWATLNGARALGFDKEIGSFEPGKRPGAVLLTGIDFDTMTPMENTASRRLI